MTLPRIIVEEQALEEVSRAWITPEELTETEHFAPARRREARAWRYIVRRELGRDADIRYNEVGAPYIANYPVHISVSHSKGRVAVAFSNRKCAVDIEQLSRNFDRVKDHYLSPEEQRLLQRLPRALATAWSAKETIYKYVGRAGLDLVKDIRLSVLPDGRLSASLPEGDELAVGVELHDNEDFVLISIH